MLYFGAVDCQYALARWSESVGSAFIRCARGRSKKIFCIECDACANARRCMRANQNARAQNGGMEDGILSADVARSAE